MAFFDDIGKKLSQAGQTAVQKTKEVADIARLNSAISDEEKRINNTYLQIGKLYISLHGEDYEEAFADMIAAVKESETKIGEYRQQIKDIKGIVRCEKCGAEVASNVAFCSSCGAAMPKEEPASPAEPDENSVKCSGCGAIVPKGTNFCTGCGTRIEAEPEAPAPAPAEETAPAENKCPSCGADTVPGSSFCTECGTKLN